MLVRSENDTCQRVTCLQEIGGVRIPVLSGALRDPRAQQTQTDTAVCVQVGMQLLTGLGIVVHERRDLRILIGQVDVKHKQGLKVEG